MSKKFCVSVLLVGVVLLAGAYALFYFSRTNKIKLQQELEQYSVKDAWVTESFEAWPGDLAASSTKHTLLMGSRIDLSNERKIALIDNGTGKEMWQTQLPRIAKDAVLGDSVTVVSSWLSDSSDKSAFVGAYRTNDGSELWSSMVGNNPVALASLQRDVLATTREGLILINPNSGVSRSFFSAHEIDYPVSAVASANIKGRDIIAYSTGSLLRLLARDSDSENPYEVFRFRAARNIRSLALQRSDNDYWLIAMGNGIIYGIDSTGKTLWKKENSDLNLDPKPLKCSTFKDAIVLRNFYDGAYIVDRNGILSTISPPAGNMVAGFIPLPIPAYLTTSLAVFDADDDGNDDIILGTQSDYFISSCDLSKKWRIERNHTYLTAIGNIQKLPHYPAIMSGTGISIVDKNGIMNISLSTQAGVSK